MQITPLPISSLLGNSVKKTGNETVQGEKTFEDRLFAEDGITSDAEILAEYFSATNNYAAENAGLGFPMVGRPFRVGGQVGVGRGGWSGIGSFGFDGTPIGDVHLMSFGFHKDMTAIAYALNEELTDTTAMPLILLQRNTKTGRENPSIRMYAEEIALADALFVTNEFGGGGLGVRLEAPLSIGTDVSVIDYFARFEDQSGLNQFRFHRTGAIETLRALSKAADGDVSGGSDPDAPGQQGQISSEPYSSGVILEPSSLPVAQLTIYTGACKTDSIPRLTPVGNLPSTVKSSVPVLPYVSQVGSGFFVVRFRYSLDHNPDAWAAAGTGGTLRWEVLR